MDIVNSSMIGLWSFVLALTPFVMAALTMLLSGATVESVYEHTLAAIFKAIAEKFKSAGGWIKGAQPLLVLALSIGTAYALGMNYIPSAKLFAAGDVIQAQCVSSTDGQRQHEEGLRPFDPATR